MEKKNTGTKSVFITFCALTLYMLHSITNGINPAMATLMQQYPDASVTTITLLSSIVMIGAIPGNLICGTVVNKIGFKATLYAGIIVALIGGIVPFFIPEIAIGKLIFCRFLVGVAYGFFLPLGTTYISAEYEGDRKARLLGLGSSFAGLAGMLSTWFGGFFLRFGLRYMYLYHLLILIPPMIFCLFLPKMQITSSETGEAEKADWHLNRQSVFYAAIQSVAMLALYPIMVYISNVVAGNNLGTSQDATNIMTVFTLASTICGFCFGVTGKLGERLMGVTWLLMAVGMACVAFGQDLMMLYIGNILAGFCYTTFVIDCMNRIGICSKPSQVANVVGLGFALTCIAPTICNYFYAWIVKLFGREGDFRFYFIVSVVLFAAVGGYYLIRPVHTVSYEENLKRKETNTRKA